MKAFGRTGGGFNAPTKYGKNSGNNTLGQRGRNVISTSGKNEFAVAGSVIGSGTPVSTVA
jgi:hypothetical protein